MRSADRWVCAAAMAMALDLEPTIEVGSGVNQWAFIEQDGGGAEGAGQLRNQLLLAVLARAEANLPHDSRSIEPRLLPGGVTMLVKERREVGVGCFEPLELGNLDVVIAMALPRGVAAIPDRRRVWHTPNQELGSFDSLVLPVLL